MSGGDELPSHLEECVALFCPLPPSHTQVHFSISQSHSMHVAIGTLMQCMSLCLCVSMCVCVSKWNVCEWNVMCVMHEWSVYVMCVCMYMCV